MEDVHDLSLPTRDQELWTLAISIEGQHGVDGPRVIAEKIGIHALAGEIGALSLWQDVARRYALLNGDRQKKRSSGS